VAVLDAQFVIAMPISSLEFDWPMPRDVIGMLKDAN
jgi:hypothetical protein